VQRVLIIGSGGAGKSYLATRLAGVTGLPLIHLDHLYWRPGWIATPDAGWVDTISRLVRRDRWIMDGNYGGTMAQRLAACDTVVFLDMPRGTCLIRLLRRRIRFAGRGRPSGPPGCPERITLGFLWWVWTYRSRRRPGILQRLRLLPAGIGVHVLRSAADVERFVAAASITRHGVETVGSMSRPVAHRA